MSKRSILRISTEEPNILGLGLGVGGADLLVVRRRDLELDLDERDVHSCIALV